MSADPKLVRDLFLAAVELPAVERAAYLAANDGGDADVRAAVERLLAAHEQPASVPARPAPGIPPAYRLRKFARKHRTALTTAAAFVVLLAAGAAIATWQAVRATRAVEDNGRDPFVPLLEERLKLMKTKHGPDHTNTLTSMHDLALAYYFAGKLDLALPLYEETLERQKAKLGPDHPDTLMTMNNLAAWGNLGGRDG
jgi:hypothetical protein